MATTSSTVPTPWSKKHKSVTKASAGGLSYSLSNSFAEPLTNKELLEWSRDRGDHALVNEYLEHSLHYTPNGGSLDLREAIANLYGPKIAADNILVFPGAQVAIETAARCICDESTHAITFTPGYQSVQEGPRQAGASVSKLKLSPDNGFQIDPVQVQAAIRENTNYLVLNQPHNPFGTLITRETQTALMSIASQHNLYIMCDEVYRLLEHDDERRLAEERTTTRLPAIADCYDKGLSCVTLSKPWGGCGITIGWIATQDLKMLDKLRDLQYFGTACVSRASEVQAIMVLRESDRILDRNLQIIRRNKTLLAAFLDEYAEFFEWVVPPTAGAIAALHFKGPWPSDQLGTELAAAGISIKPAYCFSEQIEPKEKDFFRVGFGESIMPAALDALRHFVEEHKMAWREAMMMGRCSKGERAM